MSGVPHHRFAGVVISAGGVISAPVPALCAPRAHALVSQDCCALMAQQQAATPGQALILRVMLQPNTERGAEWRVRDVVTVAAQRYGCQYVYESACTAMLQKMVKKARRRGLLPFSKASRGVSLFRLTDKARSVVLMVCAAAALR